MKSRSIRLEFLRTGPEHNQLLSPLTPYLAVCGNRPAETVHLSAEHLDVIDRLDRLRYTHGITTNEADLRAASEPVVQLLSSIRGLHEELACVMQDKVELVHLRLILSAQELALLPFELAYGPNTRPPTRDIGLASPPQLVLTREARRLARKVDFWPDKPRILVVMADPTANGLPRKPHMLALRNALDPWIEPASSTDPDAASKPIDEYVTVLDRASIERIAEACTKTEYTHVHHA